MNVFLPLRLSIPVNILNGLDSGCTWTDLCLPHSCPSWFGRGWASPSAAQVLGLSHLLAWACPIGHAQAIDWACHSWRMPKKHTMGVPKQEDGQAQVRAQYLGLPKQCPRSSASAGLGHAQPMHSPIGTRVGNVDAGDMTPASYVRNRFILCVFFATIPDDDSGQSGAPAVAFD